jgi:selenocysteine lyase/cysteine desulfurase
MTHPDLVRLRAQFDSVPGYLNAATLGLPTRGVLSAVRTGLDEWAAGRASAPDYDEAVRRSRVAYARLVDVPPSWVAVGSQVSAMVAPVAASLPDGAHVLTVAEDFASIQFPFLVHRDRGVSVRQVPLTDLADAVTPDTDVVAFSLVQSADGRVADAGAITAAAEAVGALTVVDTTQAAGWYPVHAAGFDVTLCSAYKWLCSPRGTAFLTVRPELLDRFRPLHAGWYAGESVWQSVYGPGMQLAGDARRFDVSPAWLAWVGTAPALEAFADADREAVRGYDVRLAGLLRERLGLPASDSAMVALDDPAGSFQATLVAAGCAVAARAGRVRLAFHVWNDEDDVQRAADALRAQPLTAIRTAAASSP